MNGHDKDHAHPCSAALKFSLKMSDCEVYHTDSCIRGHHIYKDLWSPTLGEELLCAAEFANVHDP